MVSLGYAAAEGALSSSQIHDPARTFCGTFMNTAIATNVTALSLMA
jgi:hypothetical protein